MRCSHPTCNHDRSKVLNARQYDDATWRSRECTECGERWSTYEIKAKGLLRIAYRLGLPLAEGRRGLMAWLRKYFGAAA